MPDTATVLPPVDRAHLREMTMGDAVLAREVLALFDRQLAIMLRRLPAADAAAKSDLAHALKGSARGIGAWRVADAATLVGLTGDAMALKDLAEAVAEVRAEIARLLKEDKLF